MKKRMLITTIVMVLVVAIALTTSSLAWFTMSASVSISEVSFGAVNYQGANLSVSGLGRNTFTTSASIGTGVTFKPVQGEPIVYVDAETGNFVFNTNSHNDYTFNEGTWFSAIDVTTTAAGNDTENQKVKLEDIEDSLLAGEGFFLGGFNVRNNGTTAASPTVSAVLNVGKVNLIDPDGDNGNGDEFYLYGEPTSDLSAISSETTGVGVNAITRYYGPGSAALDDDDFDPDDRDKALAGGLRVAVFTREWTWKDDNNGQTYDYINAAAVRTGIYSFSQYDVSWNDVTGTFVVDDDGDPAGASNNLYVTAPSAGSVYSKNVNLADEGCHVVSAGSGISSYSLDTPIGAGNALPDIEFDEAAESNYSSLAPVNAGIYSGVEIIVVVWLDGWDDESLPVAGQGRVSLSYNVVG